jgi:MFS family permease
VLLHGEYVGTRRARVLEPVKRQAAMPSVPTWWPRQWYYGWALVGTLGMTATVSYGVLYYAFAVFVTPMSDELGWTKAEVTGAFSLGSLVMGLAAIGVGHWVDRHGARALMTAGSALATGLLLAWANTSSLIAFYLVWAAMGLAMAATLYEPAFAVIAVWFRRRRSRALTVLTFLGGFASVIFVPLTTWLVASRGWREALVWLAVICAVMTVLPHWIVLRRRPEDVALAPDGQTVPSTEAVDATSARSEPSVSMRSAVGSASFRRIALAFAFASFTTTAVAVHLVPLLLERGHGLVFAGTSMGLLGLMALPGRLVFTPLGARWSRPIVTASIFGLSSLACAVLMVSRHPVAVWTFVVLFGAGFGAITPARAALVAELYGSEHYGRISGLLSLLNSFARAAGPIGASFVHAAGASLWSPRRGYDVVLALLLGLCAASALVMLAIRDSRDSVQESDRRRVDGSLSPHSVRSDTMGSTLAARRAGR